MNKSDFEESMRYTVAWKDENGKARPVNFYTYVLHDDFMIVRMTDKTGLLHKIAYEDVMKIVKSKPSTDAKTFVMPAAVLDSKTWAGRTTMMAYGSAPGMGK